ncbi:MAG TPA: HlyD family efflux transporter periplasmic adaptor subunit [Alphaproteobacteria bacterium]|nr:HlyD family efflux transporter periplasmic adaptor subunit [Alphaproteobacteria bacterium]HOO51902.1 HlyD family efflux transporter periplasmic adaptor subunit [Alphaproteobacteria bacterium]
MRFSRNIITFIAVVAVCSGAVLLYNPEEKQAVAANKPRLQIGALAWIEPKSRVINLGSPNMIEGARVQELYVDEGDVIQAGQSLGIFSSYAKNKAALDVAEANLKFSEANLLKVEAGSKASDISSQKQVVAALTASAQAAGLEFERIAKLYEARVVAKSQYDIAKGERDRLSAQRRAAQETLKSLENVRPDDIQIAKAQVLIAKAEVAVAKANVDLSTIISPIDGVVLSVYSRSGEAVGNIGVMDVANLEVIDAVAEIDESDVLRVQKGQKAEVDVIGLDFKVSGVVREIGGQIRKNSVLDTDTTQMLDTRILEVRVELDQAQNENVRRLINKKAHAKIFP